jgi:hypothetical protein
MKKYKLMIIDDCLVERKNAYRHIFSEDNFELILVGSSAELREIVQKTPVDGYVVDAILDTGDWSHIGTAAKLFAEILNAPPRPAPVFLISHFWGNSQVIDILTEINKRKNVEVIRYLAFQEFEQAEESQKSLNHDENCIQSAKTTALRSKILDDLSIWHEFSSFRPKPDDSIRILLLADLQYGDTHTSKAAKFDEQWVGRALHRDGLMPDIIVFAGDIAFTGAPHEYQIAKSKIEDLVKFMWSKDQLNIKRERIILVPGNHDVNLRFAACDGWNWERDNKKWAAKGASNPSVPTEGEVYSCHQDFALEPFRQFARALTGSRAWDEGRSQCRVDRRFEHCGIRFFLFNSITELNIEEPTKAKFDEAALSKITEGLGVDDKPDDVFSMAVSHHGVQSGQSSVQIENWNTVGKQYFNEHKIRLWMFGHYHANLPYKYSEKPFNKSPLAIVQAATLKIYPEDGDDRGFSLIELHRRNGQVSAIDEYFYKLDKDGVSQDKPKANRIFDVE